MDIRATSVQTSKGSSSSDQAAMTCGCDILARMSCSAGSTRAPASTPPASGDSGASRSSAHASFINSSAASAPKDWELV